LSLRRSQLESGAGAELLALCQTVTEDGSVSNDEILALRSWLKENRQCDFPAIGFLTAIVERIIADRRVTREERKELHKVLESILPPELRKFASAQRRLSEAEEREQARAAREAAKKVEREERERRRPVWSANFMVAGVRFDGRPEVIKGHVRAGDQVFLARDPQNAFSRNAIEIRIANGLQIGFVPEDDAVDMARFLDDEYPHMAYVTKVLTGGRTPIPVVQADIFRNNAGIDGLIYPGDIPRKRAPISTRASRSHASNGPVLAVLFIAFVALALVLLRC
jgi:hypothetical protein